MEAASYSKHRLGEVAGAKPKGQMLRQNERPYKPSSMVGRCRFVGQGESLVPPHTRGNVSPSLSRRRLTRVDCAWFQRLKLN